MSTKRFTLKPSPKTMKCPKCNQNTEFFAHSERCAEDCCEIWISCKCGHDPTATDTMHRIEDVWGSLSREMIQNAVMWTWNDMITADSKRA